MTGERNDKQIILVGSLWGQQKPAKKGGIAMNTGTIKNTASDIVPAGVFYGGDQVSKGSFHGGDAVSAGTFHS